MKSVYTMVIDAEDEARRTLADNVRLARKRLGLTLEETAIDGDLHWRHVQKVEAAEVNVTLHTLVCLATALETSPASLLTKVRKKA